jgi:hypothetical protein
MNLTHRNIHETIARQFCRELQRLIGTKKLALAARRNQLNPNKAVCHTHDFCDANVAMDAAFKVVTGRNASLRGTLTNVVWQQAWALARAARFQPDAVGQPICFDVQYHIQVQAATEREAAEQVLAILRKPDNQFGLNFEVGRFTGRKKNLLPKGYTNIDLATH